MSTPKQFIKRVRTDIAGFDELAKGGLPEGRTAVISGSAGSGKTLFGVEFLYRGIVGLGEPGLFVTFEERQEDVIKEVAGFGWDLARLERRGLLTFVDASRVAENQTEVGEYDLGALIARIKFGITKVKARRVVIDGIGSLFLRYQNNASVRRELFRIIAALRSLGVTTMITAERVSDSEPASRFGVEDFVADSVIYLYNTVVGRQRERQIEIVKLRGGSHQTGRHPFLITNDGITVFPDEGRILAEEAPVKRLSSGVKGVDAMIAGGIFRGTTTLLLGQSGTGRTVLGLHFLAEGVKRRERGVFFSFEESRPQIVTDAKMIGIDLATAERSRLLRIDAWPPEAKPIEAYLKKIKDIVGEFAPKRVVIDSLTPLANSVDEQRFRRFISSLSGFLKNQGITAILNYTGGSGTGAAIATDSDLAVIADNIIVMKFAEVGSKMERVILVSKSRASAHDKEVRRYTITDRGLRVLTAADDGCGGSPAAVKRPAGRRPRRARG